MGFLGLFEVALRSPMVEVFGGGVRSLGFLEIFRFFSVMIDLFIKRRM